MIRESGGTTEACPDGKKLVMVFGVVAIPENTELKGEHKYSLVGHEVPDKDINLAVWHLALETGEDCTNESRGHDVSGLLMAPRWKVG